MARGHCEDGAHQRETGQAVVEIRGRKAADHFQTKEEAAQCKSEPATRG